MLGSLFFGLFLKSLECLLCCGKISGVSYELFLSIGKSVVSLAGCGDLLLALKCDLSYRLYLLLNGSCGLKVLLYLLKSAELVLCRDSQIVLVCCSLAVLYLYGSHRARKSAVISGGELKIYASVLVECDVFGEFIGDGSPVPTVVHSSVLGDDVDDYVVSVQCPVGAVLRGEHSELAGKVFLKERNVSSGIGELARSLFFGNINSDGVIVLYPLWGGHGSSTHREICLGAQYYRYSDLKIRKSCHAVSALSGLGIIEFRKFSFR